MDWNAVGLERRDSPKNGFEKFIMRYRVLLASKLNTSQALEKLKFEGDLGEDVEMLIRFIESSERGVSSSESSSACVGTAPSASAERSSAEFSIIPCHPSALARADSRGGCPYGFCS